MELILSEMSLIQKLLPQQTGRAAPDWRWSRHCLRVPLDGGLLLYHTMSGCMAALDAAEASRVSRDDELRQALARHWLLVPPEHDERKLTAELRQITRLIQGEDRHVTGFTVLPTTGCNARCAYCFEQGTRPVSMSTDIARNTAEYIARACGGEPVKIEWFGGEPLVNIPAIREICRGLRERGVRFRSEITTNGYYLTPEIAREAAEDWALRSAQITLDGTRGNYERIKRYADGSNGAFDRVMNNIEAALDAGIGVNARLNLDRGNADDLDALVDQLAERFGGREGFRVLVVLIQSYGNRIDAFPSAREATERAQRLRKKAADFGVLFTPGLIRGLRINHCKADMDGAEVILPDGRISKCEHVLSGPYLGSIFDADRDAAERERWRQTMPELPACADCVLYPLCIRPKPCAFFQNGCDEETRLRRTEKLRSAVLAEYHSHK